MDPALGPGSDRFPSELHGVVEGTFPRGPGANWTKYCTSLFPLVFFSWDLTVGEQASETGVSTSKRRLVKKCSHRQVLALPLVGPHASLVPRAGPKPLPCSGNAILSSTGGDRTWLGSSFWSVSYELFCHPDEAI